MAVEDQRTLSGLSTGELRGVQVASTVRNKVNRCVDGGSTANLCALDISKAFDKVNHNALFIKLMKRRIPIALLNMLVNWLDQCSTCIKSNGMGYFPEFFKLDFGVRQGSVLSPYLFAVYLDDIIDNRYNGNSCFVILYADDIILITHPVSLLLDLLLTCEIELSWLDMCITAVTKSCCLRIGQRCNVICSSIVSSTILLYGLEAAYLRISEVRSLDFVVNRFLMKLFQTGKISVINDCISYFNFELPSSLLVKRQRIFKLKYDNCDNLVCKLFYDL
jgi:Reverse transcriptase (RNA-dependent DNA polymerase)